MTRAIDPLDDLTTIFPGREAILKQLAAWLDHTIACAPAIHLFGHHATGKTALVKHFFQTVKSSDADGFRYAYIDAAAAAYLPKVMFESIMDQLWHHQPSDQNHYQHVAKCDTIGQLQTALLHFFRAHPQTSACIVLDHADVLALTPALFSAMMALISLVTPAALTILTLSHLPWSHFEAIRVTAPPKALYFAPYRREEVLHVAARHLDANHTAYQYWPHFCEFLYDTIYAGYNRDIAEFLRLADLFFPLYIEPLDRKMKISNARLIRLIQPHIRQYSDKLYNREITAEEWQSTLQDPCFHEYLPEADDIHKRLSAKCKELTLPRQSMYILLAAYLASYLPTNLDGMYFGTNGTASGRRKRKSLGSAKVSKAAEQRILGPRAFPVDRCLAILYCIWGDEVGKGAEIHKQVDTLISLRLLVSTTPKDNLDAMKCKCMASWTFIQSLAKNVRFDIAQYFQ